MAAPGDSQLYDSAAAAAAERLKKERTYRSKVTFEGGVQRVPHQGARQSLARQLHTRTCVLRGWGVE